MSDNKGLDCGTAFLVSAEQTDKGDVVTRKIRDAFFDMDKNPLTRNMLQKAGVNFVEQDNKLIVLGDEAVHFANMAGKEARRPLSQGMVASGEIEALDILHALMKAVLGKPKKKDALVVYSVPSAPIDVLDRDIIYHESVLKKIIEKVGYQAKPMNEALAVCYSQCANEGFSGLTMSFGGGMVNCALSFLATPAVEFSVARGGDWIDQQASKAVGKTASQIQVVKESDGFNLTKPKNREEEAIAAYYNHLIDYALSSLLREMRKMEGKFTAPGKIPIVLAGGTTLPVGFVEAFKSRFKEIKDFPLEISEVRHADDPLFAVAKGLLVAAQLE